MCRERSSFQSVVGNSRFCRVLAVNPERKTLGVSSYEVQEIEELRLRLDSSTPTNINNKESVMHSFYDSEDYRIARNGYLALHCRNPTIDSWKYFERNSDG